MWMLANDTPYAAERTLVCDKNGADVWVVAVKGTFNIRPDGTTVISEKQEEVVQAPKHRDDPKTSSLLYESDLDYTKRTTDILLHGHAFAPGGKPTTQVEVTMKVDRMSKTLRVFGDRKWRVGALTMSISSPEPFVKMPLIYERAYGGRDDSSPDPNQHTWETHNPIGVGFMVKSDQPLPNVEHPRQLFRGMRKRSLPAGFGPIPRHWSPRRELAGTYDDKWQQDRLPLLPLDFNEKFFQCAPEDQQTPAYLQGDEPVELLNLTPTGTLRFKVPRVALRLHTRLAGQVISQRPNLHTVILEPDVPRVLLVWHIMVPCHGKKLKLRGTTIIEKPIRPLGGGPLPKAEPD
jgi:hypothetical protein